MSISVKNCMARKCLTHHLMHIGILFVGITRKQTRNATVLTSGQPVPRIRLCRSRLLTFSGQVVSNLVVTNQKMKPDQRRAVTGDAPPPFKEFCSVLAAVGSKEEIYPSTFLLFLKKGHHARSACSGKGFKKNLLALRHLACGHLRTGKRQMIPTHLDHLLHFLGL